MATFRTRETRYRSAALSGGVLDSIAMGAYEHTNKIPAVRILKF
jgi:hypothetical protein